jgi:hypothetical protein
LKLTQCIHEVLQAATASDLFCLPCKGHHLYHELADELSNEGVFRGEPPIESANSHSGRLSDLFNARVQAVLCEHATGGFEEASTVLRSVTPKGPPLRRLGLVMHA